MSPCLAGGGGPGQVYDLRVIALSGDDAPGLFAGSFVGMDLPTINASGQIAFFGQTDGAVVGSGLWSTQAANPSALQLIAGENLFPPGVPNGVRFDAYENIDLLLTQPGHTDDGAVAFWSRLDGYGGEDRGGLFRFDDGVLEPIALPNQSVPGLGGVHFGQIAARNTGSSGGLAAFTATLAGPGVNAHNDEAVFVEWFGGLTTIVREGGAAPGLPGRTWSPFGTSSSPQLAANGRMTFPTFIAGESFAGTALWSGFPGAFEPLIVSGDVLPNGEIFRVLSGGSFASNDAGTVVAQVLHGPEVGSVYGIFRFDNGNVSIVADHGAVGPIGTYADFYSIGLAADGTAFFIARFDGAAPDADSALLRQRPGYPAEVLLREGDPVFGSGAGVVYDEFFNEAGTVAIDGSGRCFIRTEIRGPGITDEHNTGVWMVNPGGAVNLVLRAQQGVTVAPFDTRFVSTARLRPGLGPQSGIRGGVNERGDIALAVDFTDGSTAIVHGFLPPFCPADRDGDGFITFDDLLIVLAEFGNTGPVGTGGDANWDGDVDFDDLLLILVDFGSACTPV